MSSKLVKLKENVKPSYDEAISALKTIINWIGDDADRPGVRKTPERILGTYEELFSGYDADPADILSKAHDPEGYHEIVLLKRMRFVSHCQHHIMPIVGHAHIAYIPNKKMVGISKLARLLDCYAKRLQTQEYLTKQVADMIKDTLDPLGIAIIIEAEHQCMSTRGVQQESTTTVTSQFHGVFAEDPSRKAEFFQLIK